LRHGVDEMVGGVHGFTAAGAALMPPRPRLSCRLRIEHEREPVASHSRRSDREVCGNSWRDGSACRLVRRSAFRSGEIAAATSERMREGYAPHCGAVR
jgi:hypothetical protein